MKLHKFMFFILTLTLLVGTNLEPGSAQQRQAEPKRLGDLQHRTGWLFVGFLAADADRWITEDSFQMNGKKLSEAPEGRVIPVPGDHLRLIRSQPLVILDFTSTRELKRDHSPTSVPLLDRNKDFTPIVVTEGTVVVVREVQTGKVKHVREVWVKVSPP